jgi:DNA polymerase III gamma/tau subunit
LAPYEGKYKVFIVDGVEFMSIGAANRLLKTIEEPVENVIFILLTSNQSLVPVTIVSRCQRIEILPVAAETIEKGLIELYQVEPDRRRNCCPGLPTAVSDGPSPRFRMTL